MISFNYFKYQDYNFFKIYGSNHYIYLSPQIQQYPTLKIQLVKSLIISSIRKVSYDRTSNVPIQNCKFFFFLLLFFDIKVGDSKMRVCKIANFKVPFLTSSVPNLSLDGLVIDEERPGLELDSDGGFGV